MEAAEASADLAFARRLVVSGRLTPEQLAWCVAAQRARALPSA